jgi:hypothetical protein
VRETARALGITEGGVRQLRHKVYVKLGLAGMALEEQQWRAARAYWTGEAFR